MKEAVNYVYDVIIEKVKGLVLGNLCIIQLIEVNIQLILRIFFSVIQDVKIEDDD